MIRITSRKEGFRRCGVVHSTEPTEHPDDRFTADELERLLFEPMLMVEVVADELDAEGKKEPANVKPNPAQKPAK